MKSILCIHSTMGTTIINYMVIFLMMGSSFILSEDSFDNRPLRTQNINLQVKSFATGFEIPWGMAFLPDTSMLVTDLSGVLFRVYQNGKKDKIKGLPDVYYRGQGGLLDVEVHLFHQIQRKRRRRSRRRCQRHCCKCQRPGEPRRDPNVDFAQANSRPFP